MDSRMEAIHTSQDGGNPWTPGWRQSIDPRMEAIHGLQEMSYNRRQNGGNPWTPDELNWAPG